MDKGKEMLIIASLFFFGLGYLVRNELHRMRTKRKDTICVVYNKTTQTSWPARLFHDLDDDDQYAVLKVVQPNTLKEGKLPFLINKDRIRFLTDEGERVTMANWHLVFPNSNKVAAPVD
jgi:hypothetical protein